MLPYTAPQKEMLTSLLDIANGRHLLDEEGLSADIVASLLAEAAKLAEAEIAPTLAQNDQHPPTLKDGQVWCGPEAHQTIA